MSPGTVVCGIVEPSGNAAAIGWAALLARRGAARLVVVDVQIPVPPPLPLPLEGPPAALSPAVAPFAAGQPSDEVRRALRDAAGPTAGYETVTGEPVDVLRRRCQDERDLLVVADRGAGTLAGAVERAPSRRLLHDAPCPLLVVPEATDAPPQEGELALVAAPSAGKGEADWARRASLLAERLGAWLLVGDEGDDSAAALIECARRRRADAIVVAAPSRRSLPAAIAGSPAHQLLEDGSFAVLVVPSAGA